MRMAFIAVMVLAALAFSAPAFAGTGAGTKELGINITSQKFEVDETNTKVTTSIINLLYGYYLSDRVEVAGNICIIENDLGGIDTTQTNLELQGKFHFPESSAILIPYLGLAAGIYNFDDGGVVDASGTSYGFMGGAKYMVVPSASVNLEYSFRSAELEDDNKNKYESTLTTLSIGFSVYF